MIVRTQPRSYRDFGALKLIPEALAPSVKSFLKSQGLAQGVISGSGDVDAQSLIGLAFDKIEVRTALSPPITINLASKAPPDPETERILKLVQPAVILTGRAGQVKIAPYGIPAGISPEITSAAKKLALGVGGFLAALVLFGAILRR